MDVRMAGPADAAEVQHLWLANLKSKPALFGPELVALVDVPVAEFAGQFLANGPDDIIFGAWQDGQCVGMLRCAQGRGRFAAQANLAGLAVVVDDSAKQAVCRGLLEVAVAHARTLFEVTEVRLTVVADDHLPLAWFAELDFEALPAADGAPFTTFRRSLAVD